MPFAMPPTRLERLVFLIHPFCYVGEDRDSPRWPFAQRERRCAARWMQGVAQMCENEALAVIPIMGRKPLEATNEFIEKASAILGRRALDISFPYLGTRDAWDEFASLHAEEVVADLRDAYLGQGEDWNKEELYTALHCRGCAAVLLRKLRERDLTIDPSSLVTQAWGESFDGCVTKYSINLRRLLGLERPVDIVFDMGVPDAAFLLEAKLLELIELEQDLRLFVFETGDRLAALFVSTRDSLAHPARRVKVPVDPQRVTVRTKRGGRLWPPPAEDDVRWPSIGVTEPPQELVCEEDGELIVPVSTGVVYRLAKAPAYIMSEPGAPFATFREQLVRATTV